MQVPLSALKINPAKYFELASKQEIVVTKNGKRVGRILGERPDKAEAARAFIGSIKSDRDYDDIRNERITE